MMRFVTNLVAASLSLMALFPAQAQQGGTSPPTVTIIQWRVYRGPEATEQRPRNGDAPPVYDMARGDSRSNIEGSGLNNAGAFLHMERDWESLQGDRVVVVVRISDADWGGDPDQQTDEGVFYRLRAQAVPYFSYGPSAPPIAEATEAFVGATEDEGFKPAPGQAYLDREVRFSIPPFNGKNQARLRGLIEWDVRWFLRIEVSNDKEPGEDAPIYYDGVYVVAIESPFSGTANAPPVADAGADRTVAAGTTVTLDGSRTFDSYNVGFDPNDPNVLDKDTLEYVWEWISGPQRVDPVYVDDYGNALSPGLARVTLNIIGTYEYRLLVSDGVNPLPSSDTVKIYVVPSLPTNQPPRAVVSGPTAAVAVGQVITLDGSGSTDPDGDTLAYRWRQTDEIGGELPPEDFLRFFQPLSGLEQATSSWQALTPGVFYFTLLVDDGEYTDAASISVEVVQSTTAGTTAEEGGRNAALAPAAGLAACGAGLLPLAVAPVGLWALRRRRC